jgi:hypothetical protein
MHSCLRGGLVLSAGKDDSSAYSEGVGVERLGGPGSPGVGVDSDLAEVVPELWPDPGLSRAV